ncbi:MAG: hypothetical protein ABGX12_03440 [Desulfurobacteriaceae bacterium]
MKANNEKGIEKLKLAFKLLQDSLRELEEVEYAFKLLEKELEEYRSLIDRESFIPKTKFVKQRIDRLIERMKYVSDEILSCIGIHIKVVGEIPETEKVMLSNYIATYVDKHIRPSDMLFKINNELIGIVFPIKRAENLKAIEDRLSTILLNLKTKTYSNQRILINFKIKSFIISTDMTADYVLSRLKDM